jgi:hypothetical protein
MAIAGQALAIQRVAPRLSLLEFRGGYGMPLGSYDQIIGTTFEFDPGEIVSFDAERVYAEGYNLGFSYGQMIGGHWLAAIGFDYARHKIENPIEQEIGPYIYTISFLGNPRYSQYDLTLKGQYVFNNLAHQVWSPFVGLAASAALSTLSAEGFETESDGTFALSLDFGVDFKIWKSSDGRAFLTLASVNSWDFVASDTRPNLLRIGGGLRYFFKH